MSASGLVLAALALKRLSRANGSNHRHFALCQRLGLALRVQQQVHKLVREFEMRFFVLATPLMTFAACADVADADVEIDAETHATAEPDDLSWLDTLALTPLTFPCTFATSGVTAGTATIQLNGAGEVLLVARRSIDSAILANGQPCGTATATSLKKLNITGGVGDDTVIIDFINGTFGAGAAGGPGIVIDLGGGAVGDFKLRGLPTADNITGGIFDLATTTVALNFGVDAFKDITMKNLTTATIATGGGNDIISMAGGNDTGADMGVIGGGLPTNGGDGDDAFIGSTGGDGFFGGTGNDTFRGGLGDDVLIGGPGSDTFDEGAEPNGSDVFIGGSDVLPAVGIDTVTYAARAAIVTVTIGDGDGSPDGAPGNDGDLAAGGELDDVSADIEVVTGSAFADNLSCSSVGCTLNGGAGNDVLVGGIGNDTLNGGAGDDDLTDDDGDDILSGDGDDDFFHQGGADNGSDTINGGTGNDAVDYTGRGLPLIITMGDQLANDGENGEGDNIKNDIETLAGGSANDNITGNDLANRLLGGDGDDILFGGLGDDFFQESGNDNGSDVFNGGAGIDTVNYGGRGNAITVTMDGLAANDGDNDGGDGAGPLNEGDNIKADVENCNGGNGSDSITGNSSSNILDGGGGGGTDTLNGGGGAGSDICLNGEIVTPDSGCDL